MKGGWKMKHKKDNVTAGLIGPDDLCQIREAVCVQTEKVYDSCKEKDCIEDANVIFRRPELAQRIINAAINVKCRSAEVIDVYADVEPVPFKRGFYTVDIKYYIKVELDFFLPNRCGPGGTNIIPLKGVVLFDKKVILFGSEGNIKIFKSRYVEGGIDVPSRSRLQQDNLPMSKIEVATPISLGARIVDILDESICDVICGEQMPRKVAEQIDTDEDSLDFDMNERHEVSPNCIQRKRVLVSVGIFSIIKLVRLTQLRIPAFDFCVPDKECVAATDENPCDLFDEIDFPAEEFFPPQKFDFPGALANENDIRDTKSIEE